MRPILLILFALSVSFTTAQEDQWADPTPDETTHTNEDTATNWTSLLSGAVGDWPAVDGDLKDQIHNLTTSCVTLGNQALSDDALDALIVAVDELLWANFYESLANYFQDQAAPLVSSATAAVGVESWDAAINYCGQAYPWLNSRDECSGYAWQRIEAAAAAYYEAELAYTSIEDSIE
jgi:hypothetical protein